jgi:exodeoxyribonuclease V gamma subunit
MINIEQSTCIHTLFNQLNHDVNLCVAQDIFSPLDTIPVIVQSPAMEKWLSIQLAKKNRIMANMHFPMPASFIWNMYKLILGDDIVNDDNHFTKQALKWKIHTLCSERFSELPSFLQTEIKSKQHNPLYLFELSEHLADLFDEYLVYRPQWISQWESESHQPPHWQAHLWKLLTANCSKDSHLIHRVHYSQACLDLLKHQAPEHLKRDAIFLFCIDNLPPQHLELFNNLSKYIPVTLYLHTPTVHFFSDIQSPKQQAWMLSQKQYQSATHLEHLHFDQGNPLLASLGTSIKNFIDQLIDIDADFNIIEPDQDEHPNRSILRHTQYEIHELLYANTQGHWVIDQIKPNVTIEEHDNSIAIHNCHNIIRELEVLKHQLLHFFSEDEHLALDDVLIMIPNLNQYIPFIPGVFHSDEKNKTIAYAISDIQILENASVSQCIQLLLKLDKERFKVSHLINLLNLPPIYERWNFTDEERKELKSWVLKNGVHWGWDDISKEKWHLPKSKKHTWKQAIDNSLLGLMLNENSPYHCDLRPENSVQSGFESVLARWFDFLNCCHTLTQIITVPKSIDSWIEIFDHIFNDLLTCATPENKAVKNALYLALSSQQKHIKQEHYTDLIPLDIILSLVQDTLSRPQENFFLLGGKVNISNMLTMTHIPFKIVCVLGLDDSFPMRLPKREFNLMDKESMQLGDRNRRHDDAYQFLQALLSCEKKLHLSYIGQHVKDNSPMNPSSFLSELITYLQAVCTDESLQSTSLHTKHPLHNFDSYYFESNSNIWNSDPYHYKLANVSKTHHYTWYNPDIIKDTPPLNTEEIQLSHHSLIAFCVDPIKHFINKQNIRLGLHAHQLIKDEEPFDITNYQDTQDMILSALEAIQNKDTLDHWMNSIRLHPSVPNLNFEPIALSSIWSQARDIEQKISHYNHANKQTISTNYVYQNINLNIYSDILVPEQGVPAFISIIHNNTNAKQQLKTYLMHLLLNLHPSSIDSHLICSKDMNSNIFLPGITGDDAAQRLHPYLDLYLQGAHQLIPFDVNVASNLASQKKPKIIQYEQPYNDFVDNILHDNECNEQLSKTLMSPAIDFIKENAKTK